VRLDYGAFALKEFTKPYPPSFEQAPPRPSPPARARPSRFRDTASLSWWRGHSSSFTPTGWPRAACSTSRTHCGRSCPGS